MSTKKHSLISLSVIVAVISICAVMFCFFPSFAVESGNIDSDDAKQNALFDEKSTTSQEILVENSEVASSNDAEQITRDTDIKKSVENELNTESEECVTLLQDSAVPNNDLPDGIKVLKGDSDADPSTDYEFSSNILKIKTSNLTIEQDNPAVSKNFQISVANTAYELTLHNVSVSTNSYAALKIENSRTENFKLNIDGDCKLWTASESAIYCYQNNDSNITFEIFGQTGSILDVKSNIFTVFVNKINFSITGALNLIVQSNAVSTGAAISLQTCNKVRFNSSSSITLINNSPSNTTAPLEIYGCDSFNLESGSLILKSGWSKGAYYANKEISVPQGTNILGSTQNVDDINSCTESVRFELDNSYYYAKIGNDYAKTVYIKVPEQGGQGGQDITDVSGAVAGVSDATTASGMSQTGDNNLVTILSLIVVIIGSAVVAFGVYSNRKEYLKSAKHIKK